MTGWRALVERAAPGVATARSYSAHDLPRDIAAGLVLTALLVPAGMAHAELAGLPPVAGLHASVVGLVVYALLGPSRILVVGPDSSLGPIIAAAVAPLAAGDADRALALAGLLAVLVGVVLVAGGALRLGFVTELLSKPIRIGYLNGIALVVIGSQLPKLLGFSTEAGDLAHNLSELTRGIGDGLVEPGAAVIGVAALAAIVVLRRYAPRVPWLLVAVAGGAAAVWALGLDDVAVVGSLPKGLPAPALDGVGVADLLELVPAALGLALIAFADTSVLSRSLASRDGVDVDESREMIAIGAANVACGALGGFPVSGSSSRTPAARESGARTQLAGLVGAIGVAALIVTVPGLTRHVPSSVLAAVVIAAVLSLADLPAIGRLWMMSGTEAALCVTATLGVALFGVLQAITVAVALSLAAFVARAWRPHHAELVRVDKRKGYHDVERHPAGRRIPGLLIIRFDAPLFFANCDVFSNVILDAVDRSDGSVRWVAVAAEPITDIDSTAADALALLDDRLRRRGVRLVFAELKGPVKDRLARFGLDSRFGPDRLFPTVGTAVSGYLRATGADYVDWTDRDRPAG